jgi:1,4-dihydroxy-2-naphthoyl-CoA hydrolase
MSYRYELKVQLHDTDAAGILFFGHQFEMAHDAYQAFLESRGFSFAEVLADGEILIPLVHAEADYLKPLKVGDRLVIELTVAGISTHSFTLSYDFRRPDGEPVGTVKTVHVTVDRGTGAKIELPGPLRKALDEIKS